MSFSSLRQDWLSNVRNDLLAGMLVALCRDWFCQPFGAIALLRSAKVSTLLLR
jgi:hypothetical protein